MKSKLRTRLTLGCGTLMVIALVAFMLIVWYLSAWRPAPCDNEVLQGEMIDTRKGAFHVVRMGEEAPLVVLESGLCASSLEWLPVQRGIARFAGVLAYDRAGYGLSPKARGSRTIDAPVEGLRALLDAIGVKRPVVIVGHDSGAIYAVRFAARHPSMIRGLVLVDPFPADMSKYKLELEAAVYRNFIDRGWILKVGKTAARTGVVRALKITPYLHAPTEIRPCLVDFFSNPANYDAALAEYRALSGPAQGEYPAALRVPVTLIRPSRVKYLDHMLFFGVPLVEARKIEALRNEYDRRLLAGSITSISLESELATNTVHLEDPDIIVRAVRKMLGR